MNFPFWKRGLAQSPARQVPDEALEAMFRNPDGANAGVEPQTRAPSSAFSGPDTLSAFGLVKSFKGRRVVNGVTLNVRKGEAVGLLGPNGAGKTTAFYMITGLLEADEGEVTLEGQTITPLPMYRRARLGIGYLPQEASIFRGLTVEDNIRAVLEVVEPNRKKREEQLDQLLEEFTITQIGRAHV